MKNLFKGLVLVALLGTVFFVNLKPALAGSAPSITRVDGPTDVKTGVGNSWTIIPAFAGDFSYYVNWADGTPEVSGTTPTFLHTYTTAAMYNVIFTIKDGSGNTNYKAVAIWVSGTTQTSLTITTASPLPNAKVGQAYSTEITATGGTLGMGSSASLSVGQLPSGISWGSCSTNICTGLTGTPTTAGTYTFTMKFTQGTLVATKDFSLTVDPAVASSLSITTTSPLPNATVGTSYSTTINSVGGSGSYSWAVLSGTLPTGFSFISGPACLDCQAATAIGGTPTTAGTYTFTLSLTMGPSQTQITQSATKQFTLTVDPATNNPTLAISISASTPVSNPNSPIVPGTTNVSLTSINVSANNIDDIRITSVDPLIRTNGIGGNINSGLTNFKLYDGTTLLSTGSFLSSIGDGQMIGFNNLNLIIAKNTTHTLVIKADAPVNTNAEFVEVSDFGGTFMAAYPVNRTDLSVSTTGDGYFHWGNKIYFGSASSSLTITTASPLPNAKVGISYFPTFTVSGGAAPYTWGLTPTTFVPGLTWDSSKCTSTMCNPITGVPTTAGIYMFSVVVNFGLPTAISKQFTLTVDPATSVLSGTLIAAQSGYTTDFAINNNGTIINLYIAANANIVDSNGNPLTYQQLKIGMSVEATGTNNNANAWNISEIKVITSPVSSITITTASSLPSGNVGKDYYSGISIVNSNNSIIVPSITAGSLPPGLKKGDCYTAGSCTLMIGGIPTTVGTYAFTLTVISGSQIATKQFTLKVVSESYYSDPGLFASVDPSTPESQIISPGSKNIIITAVKFSTTTEAVNLHTFAIAGNGSVNDIDRINLVDANSGVVIRSVTPYAPKEGIAAIIDFLSSPVYIAAHSSKVLYITADISMTATPGNPLSLGFSSIVGTSDLSSTRFDISVLQGNVMTIGSDVVNTKPLGWIDSISKDGYISGWAVDPDHLDVPINIHVYFDGPYGVKGGPEAIATATDIQRDDVNLIMSATGTHGFKIAIPNNLRDGKKHTAYVYGIDVDDSSGAYNASLWGSPRVFSLGKTNTTGRHPRGTVVIGEGATVYFIGTEMRYPYPSPEVFFSWGAKFSDLVLANAGDLAMPIGPIVQMKQ